MHCADYAVAKCLFVRLSVTRRYSVETVIHILKLFYHRVAPQLQFFDTKRYGNNPTGTH